MSIQVKQTAQKIDFIAVASTAGALCKEVASNQLIFCHVQRTKTIRPTLTFVNKYRYQLALILGFIIAFFPSLIFLFYSVFGLKE